MQLLFLLSSLGVINGLVATVFLLRKSNRTVSKVYFAGLVVALCIRIGKSVLYYFFPETDRLILQLGLSSCIFIGPFFYLYLKSIRKLERSFKRRDLYLLLSLGVFISTVGVLFPYNAYPTYWNPEIVQVIYLFWAIFSVMGLVEVHKILGFHFLIPWKLRGDQQYLALVVIGFLLITLTYQLALYIRFTYIWGAFIFSFFFYFLGFRALIAGKEIAPKPNARKLANGEDLLSQLKTIMKDEKLFTNQQLKLEDLANRLNVSRHVVSQLMNETYPNGYANFIRSYRVDEAKALIASRPELSLEGIGYEAGFKSKSVFFDAFKKIAGTTPSAYKKELERNRIH